MPQVLVSSFDWFIFFSMALVTGPDGRRWPEYETLLRATPPKLNTSCNVFVGGGGGGGKKRGAKRAFEKYKARVL